MELFLLLVSLLITLYLFLDSFFNEKKSEIELYTNSIILASNYKYKHVKKNGYANKISTSLLIRRPQDVYSNSRIREFTCLFEDINYLIDYECYLSYYIEKSIIEDIVELNNDECILLLDTPIIHIIRLGDEVRICIIFV